VRDVGKVNYSLLIKWRWRLLQNDVALWKDILVAKYGPLIRHKVHWVGSPISNGASAWWKDICGIDLKDGVSWFGQNISRKIGNELSTRFWLDCWMGNSPLCEKFPRLFSISSHKDGLVGEYWEEKERWSGGEWGWHRRLFVWEETLLNNLLENFPPFSMLEEEDSWKWVQSEDGNFTVKSTYLLLNNIFSPDSGLGDHDLRVLSIIWKSPAPSKVIAFAWKLLRNRLPTRARLAYRGVEVNGGSVICVHCQRIEETEVHLFLFCDFAMQVWMEIFRWLGLVIIIPPNLSLLFDCLIMLARNKKVRSGYSLIWHATVWMIWNSHNNVIFSNGGISPEEVVDAIKLISWRWGLSRHNIPICLYYEWCWDPGLCLCS
jgi:hypothetical protein